MGGEAGIETATFHILTPYPDTPLHVRMEHSKRIITKNWDLYDTRHAVFTPAHMSTQTLEDGYWRAYRNFYSWANILESTGKQMDPASGLRHFVYKTAWKKFEPLWDFVIQLKRVSSFTKLLEMVLSVNTPPGFDTAEQSSNPAALPSEQARFMNRSLDVKNPIKFQESE